jgi:hypothetical protein
MAQIPVTNFNPYNPTNGAGNGEAFLLGSSLTPLNLIRQQSGINQRLAAKQAADRQKEQAQEVQALQKLRLRLTDKEFLPYQPELNARKQEIWGKLIANRENEKQTPFEQRLAEQKIMDDYNSAAKWTTGVEDRFKDIVALSAKDKRYNPAAVDAALYGSLNDAEGNRLPIASFQPDVLNAILTRPDVFDRNEVAKQFLEDLSAKADMSTASTAARPGQYGQRATAESNYFELEDGTYKLDPATGQRIPHTDRTEVIEAARRDPFVSRLIDEQMHAHRKTLAEVDMKMEAFEPMTPEEQQLVLQEQTEPKRYASYLNELLLPHAHCRTSEF